MLICTYRFKNRKAKIMNIHQTLEYTSRTLKVVQIVAVVFALAQLSLALAVA
jgi:hypothetical protein